VPLVVAMVHNVYADRGLSHRTAGRRDQERESWMPRSISSLLAMVQDRDVGHVQGYNNYAVTTLHA